MVHPRHPKEDHDIQYEMTMCTCHSIIDHHLPHNCHSNHDCVACLVCDNKLDRHAYAFYLAHRFVEVQLIVQFPKQTYDSFTNLSVVSFSQFLLYLSCLKYARNTRKYLHTIHINVLRQIFKTNISGPEKQQSIVQIVSEFYFLNPEDPKTMIY